MHPNHLPGSGCGDPMTGRRRRNRASVVRAAAAPAPAPTPPTWAYGGNGGGYATQPWSHVVFPPPGGAYPSYGWPLIYDAWGALRIPGVSRALAIYSGSLKQAPMEAFRGITPLPRPRLLDQPDPNQARPWFVQAQVEDYFLNGNAVSYITAYDSTGWPAAVAWLPANWVTIACPPHRYDLVTYMVDGIELDRTRVVHVKRGADRWCPARGVSVTEQHIRSLDRIAMEEEYERDALSSGSVPSVAVITPNPRLGDDEAKEAKQEWLSKYGGPRRQPAILPAGTQVIPLAFTPEDAQLTAARAMSLLDVANMFNLDGYWLGAPGGSMTYRSPGSMYTNLLRISLENILADFESVWSAAWLPRGQSIRFDRAQLTRDDLQTMVQTVVMAMSSDPPLMSQAEGRAYLGLPPEFDGLVVTSPVDTVETEPPAPPAPTDEET
jgi:HK97 family phage portal protein